MFLTYRYRIKDSTARKLLCQLASEVNKVWNYINDLSFKNIKLHGRFLSSFDINNYTSGSCEYIPLHSTTFQEISKQYVTNRTEAGKRKLSWRSYRHSLGWIPFKASAVRINEDTAIYKGNKFRFYKSRKIPIGAEIKTGSFNQDSRGRWYCNLVVKINENQTNQFDFPNIEVGIDLGQMDKMVLSNGEKFSRENQTKKHKDQLACAQRAGKARRVAAINAKMQNSRLDWNHKQITNICKRFQKIVVGDIEISGLIEIQSKASRKSLLDSSLYQIKQFFEYKALMLGNNFSLVNEAYSTQTCNVCGMLTGPKGQTGLGVREWSCPCGAVHDRDRNAAQNILRMGHHSP